MKVRDSVIAAMARYYSHRDAAHSGVKWDKDADLAAINRAGIEAGATRFEACAGTFWFVWKRPAVQTKHNEASIDGIVIKRKVRGVWKEVQEKSA